MAELPKEIIIKVDQEKETIPTWDITPEIAKDLADNMNNNGGLYPSRYIQKAAQEGLYSCEIGHVSEATIKHLESKGYKVEPIKYKISW